MCSEKSCSKLNRFQNEKTFFFSGTFCVKLCFVKSDYVLLATESKHMFQTDLVSFQNDSPY